MALNWPAKDPDEVLDYEVDWSDRIGTDTILTSVWTLSSADIVTSLNTYTSSNTTIWLSGGVNGSSYTLTNEIVTAGGRTMDQSVNINIKTR